MTDQDRHTLMIVNPGHFHAALCLRAPHPRLNDDVHIFAADGPDLDRFLSLIDAFNGRPDAPTQWRAHVYRGDDYLERLLAALPGDIAIIAGQNHSKMAAIDRLHDAGVHVLADKPLLVAAEALPLLESAVAGAPLMMEIMTSRQEPANQITAGLVQNEAVFGGFQTGSAAPGLELVSTHHLYKEVNNRPLVRPPWYFDVTVQGEGIVDVSTHLVDIAEWLIGDGSPFEWARDVVLVDARKWPTDVSGQLYQDITGEDAFPAALGDRVRGNTLSYLCNGAFEARIRDVTVAAHVLWADRIPAGGGDSHVYTARGTRATVTIEHGADTGFDTKVFVRPVDDGPGYRKALDRAVDDIARTIPGLAVASAQDGYEVVIPPARRTTHEEHFAEVLDRFLGYVDTGSWPTVTATEVAAKYRLLMATKEAAAVQ